MDFKKIELKDRALFLKCLGNYDFLTYEYSFTTLYLWRNFLNVEFAIKDNYITVKKKCNGVGSYFVEPIGYRDSQVKDIAEELNEIKREFNMDFLFRDIEEPFLRKLINLFGDRIEYKEDENNFDYIYNTKDLATLSGVKYKKKRNRYNTFLNRYEDCYCKHINGNDQVINECKKLAEKWYYSHGNNTEELYYELQGIEDLFNNFDFLNIKAIAVYCDNRLVGFAIGEAVNEDYALIHIEKCLRQYTGVYEFINKTFIRECFPNTKLINRGEDLGDEGLRKTKMEYRPTKFGRKYIVNLK